MELMPQSTPEHRITDATMTTRRQLNCLHEQVTLRTSTYQGDLRESKEGSDPNCQLRTENKGYSTQELLPQQKTRHIENDKIGPALTPGANALDKYNLRLQADAKMHPGFHTSSLGIVDLEAPLITTVPFKTEEEDEFEVEEILERRGQQYLIKWKGYPHSENTWEPIHNLGNCQMILRQFRRTATSSRHRAAEPSRLR